MTEDSLNREKRARADIEKQRRKIEGDLKVTQESVAELERSKKELDSGEYLATNVLVHAWRGVRLEDRAWWEKLQLCILWQGWRSWLLVHVDRVVLSHDISCLSAPMQGDWP